MGRGRLNDKVQEVFKKFLEKELTIRELRLLPYIQYVLLNSQDLDFTKINDEEDIILNEWFAEGYLKYDNNDKLKCRKDFWDFMNELLYYSYVLRSEEI